MGHCFLVDNPADIREEAGFSPEQSFTPAPQGGQGGYGGYGEDDQVRMYTHRPAEVVCFECLFVCAGVWSNAESVCTGERSFSDRIYYMMMAVKKTCYLTLHLLVSVFTTGGWYLCERVWVCGCVTGEEDEEEGEGVGSAVNGVGGDNSSRTRSSTEVGTVVSGGSVPVSLPLSTQANIRAISARLFAEGLTKHTGIFTASTPPTHPMIQDHTEVCVWVWACVWVWVCGCVGGCYASSP